MPRISTIEKKVNSLGGFSIKIRNLQGEEVINGTGKTVYQA